MRRRPACTHDDPRRHKPDRRPPTGSLTLSPNSLQPLPAGGQQTFTVLASDASGAPVLNLNVGLVVTGVDDLQLSAVTDSTGHARVVYKNVNPGTASVQAVAFISGMVAFEHSQCSVDPSGINRNHLWWKRTLNISISAQSTVTLPSSLQLNGAVTDSSGNTISTNWTQVSGPGTVTFASPQQIATTAAFSLAGS